MLHIIFQYICITRSRKETQMSSYAEVLDRNGKTCEINANASQH